jgi:hypothetical protein
VLDATVVWKERPYTPGQMRAFMWAWNGTGVGDVLELGVGEPD